MRRVALVTVALAWPGSAAAANGATPRTPPVFGEPPCLTVVDRSVDAVLPVAVGLPWEDAIVTEDELADSRTLQLFAACRPERAGDRLPAWIRASDAARALEAMLIPELPDDDAVLETASAWASGHDARGPCVIPLVAAEARLPLTCAAVEPGVEWDTSTVPAGAYAIYGYTFEPAVNLWTRRRGVVVVVDDAGDPPPVAALLSPDREATVYESSSVALEGCAVGSGGATVQLAWAPVTAPDLADEAAWTPFAELEVAADPTAFAVDFHPPPQAAGQALVVRARASDAAGRAWTDFATGTLLVYPGAGRSDAPLGPLVPDVCGTAAGSGESSDDAPPSDPAGASACGCDAPRGPLAWALLAWALALRRPARCAKVPGRARAAAPA
jgi:hypothetical protein